MAHILAPESDRLSSDTTAFIVLCQFVKPSGKTRFDFAPHGRRLLALSFRREEIVVEPNLSLHTLYFFFAEQRVCVCVSAKSLRLSRAETLSTAIPKLLLFVNRCTTQQCLLVIPVMCGWMESIAQNLSDIHTLRAKQTF